MIDCCLSRKGRVKSSDNIFLFCNYSNYHYHYFKKIIINGNYHYRNGWIFLTLTNFINFQHNFVTGSIDCIEFEAKDEPIDNNSDFEVLQSTPKDPRAGHVDVLLPQLNFDGNLIVELFEQAERDFGTKNRVANAVKNKYVSSEFFKIAI